MMYDQQALPAAYPALSPVPFDHFLAMPAKPVSVAQVSGIARLTHAGLPHRPPASAGLQEQRYLNHSGSLLGFAFCSNRPRATSQIDQTGTITARNPTAQA